MNFEQLDALCKEQGCQVYKDEPMSQHTSFKIGGSAQRLVCVNNSVALAKILGLVSRLGLPHIIIGNGSNMLVCDSGIKGIVIVLGTDFMKIRLEGTKIICGSGVSLSALCIFARNNCLSGLEFAFGIPGTAGGAAYMNAGAYGGEMKDVLALCRHMDINGNLGAFKGGELQLGYRKSAYSGKNFVITELELDLKPGKKEEISAKMEELINRRKDKQPLEFPSAGSVFKRPEGHFAAALIEECGLKGLTVGGAQVSVKHSGFIVNKGGATFENVTELINKIKSTVLEKKGIALECEIMMIK